MRFAPTGWCQIEEVPRCSIRGARWYSCSLRGQVISTWMTFGGNTRDLGSFREETDKTMTLHQEPGRIIHSELGDGVATIKRRRYDIHGGGVRDSVTTSGRGRLKVDLEPSTWR
ncbi:hypothetical protein Tco_1417156 [Tanacetum coccineum]